MGKKNSRRKNVPAPEKTSTASVPSVRTVFDFNNPRFIVFISLLLFGVVVLTFLPTLHGDFIQFDDGDYVVRNAHVNTGLTLKNIAWSLTGHDTGNWHPLTWCMHMLDCQIYGLKPAGHHLTNVLIHALNTVLVFLVLRKLTGANGRSLIVALLFGLHPLRVESVAWISELKDVLSAMFWMLTLLVYAKYAETSAVRSSRRKSYYALALILFVCGLMSKQMVVTLPCVLLILDYWPLKRFGHVNCWRLLAEKVPFFLLAGAASVLAYKAQSGGDINELSGLTFNMRLENALVSYSRYLGNLFWPTRLCALYPYPENWPLFRVLFAGLLIAVVSVFAFIRGHRQPYFLIGWLWFLGTLVPVIGLFVQAGPQAMADRFFYIPSLGILIAVVWGLHELSRSWRYQAAGAIFFTSVVSIVCIVLTWHQISYWKDGVTVWRRAVDLTQDNFTAHMRLGLALLTDKRFDGALVEFQEASRLKPDDSAANWLLAGQLNRMEHLPEAIEHYQKSLAINPTNSLAEYGLGGCYFKQGNYAEAIVHFEKAAEYDPYDKNIRNDLGVAFLRNQQLDEAISCFQNALMLDPDYSIARTNLDGTLKLKLSDGK